MKKQTQAIHTRFQHRDAYNALSMPVYHTAAYEFEDAVSMSDAFCGRTDAPDYSRVMNPTVTFFDFMVDGTDNFAVKFLINDACVLSGKPFAWGVSFGTKVRTLPIFREPPVTAVFSVHRRRQEVYLLVRKRGCWEPLPECWGLSRLRRY